VLVDPVQLDLELLRAERERAEDTEAARRADGGDHVPAVREGEDRVLDPQGLAQFVFHCLPSRMRRRMLVVSGR